jgi:hypothetical protein
MIGTGNVGVYESPLNKAIRRGEIGPHHRFLDEAGTINRGGYDPPFGGWK